MVFNCGNRVTAGGLLNPKGIVVAGVRIPPPKSDSAPSKSAPCSAADAAGGALNEADFFAGLNAFNRSAWNAATIVLAKLCGDAAVFGKQISNAFSCATHLVVGLPSAAYIHSRQIQIFPHLVFKPYS
jgi:hypothetical protein